MRAGGFRCCNLLRDQFLLFESGRSLRFQPRGFSQAALLLFVGRNHSLESAFGFCQRAQQAVFGFADCPVRFVRFLLERSVVLRYHLAADSDFPKDFRCALVAGLVCDLEVLDTLRQRAGQPF